MIGSSTISYRRAIALGTDPGAAVLQLIFALVDAFALTMLVWFRRRFGERFYTSIHYVLGLLILGGALAAANINDAATHRAAGTVLGQFLNPHQRPDAVATAQTADGVVKFLLYGFAILGGVHLAYGIWNGTFRRNPTPILSTSTGDPWLMLLPPLRNRYWLTVCVAEPLLLNIIGSIVAGFTTPHVVLYFWAATLLMLVSATHQYKLHRDEMLDEQDNRILAGFYTAQAEHVAAGGVPTPSLAGIFRPLVLPRPRALQVDMLRQWAKQHQERAADAAPAPVVAEAPGAPPASST